MATKTEFLAELDAQIRSAREAQNQMGSTIDDNARTIADLQARRKDAVRGWRQRLLPDLKPETITALSAKLPGFTITAAQVEKMVEAAKAVYREQLQRLTDEFDVSKYGDRKRELEFQMAANEADGAPIREVYDDLVSIPDLKRLIAVGYGTDDYACHWWQGQYYRDWKAADRAVAQGRASTWGDLMAQWHIRRDGKETLDRIAADLKASLADLEAKRASHQDLTAALENAPETVREQIGVKLEASIESIEHAAPVKHFMADLLEMYLQIRDMQDSNLKLQTSRSKMAEQVAQLQNVRARAANSRKREVPDQYVTSLRSQGSISGGYTGPSVVNVYQNNDNLLFDLLLIEQMTGYFDQPTASYPDSNYGGGYTAPVAADTYEAPTPNFDPSTQS